jgi:hypothetical protein
MDLVDRRTGIPYSARRWLTVNSFRLMELVLRIWRNWQTRYFEVVVE